VERRRFLRASIYKGRKKKPRGGKNVNMPATEKKGNPSGGVQKRVTVCSRRGKKKKKNRA